jgi:hypothetical protein
VKEGKKKEKKDCERERERWAGRGMSGKPKEYQNIFGKKNCLRLIVERRSLLRNKIYHDPKWFHSLILNIFPTFSSQICSIVATNSNQIQDFTFLDLIYSLFV